MPMSSSLRVHPRKLPIETRSLAHSGNAQQRKRLAARFALVAPRLVRAHCQRSDTRQHDQYGP